MDEHVDYKMDITDEHIEAPDTAPPTHNEVGMQDIPSDMGLITKPQIQLVEEQGQYTQSSWADDIPPRHPIHPLEEQNTIPRTSEDVPTLTGTNDEEQEISRPSFIRKIATHRR
jgi:hypothetical protein